MRMRHYLIAFAAAGIVLPLLLHLLAPASMPWWPDTVSMGIAFGVTALVMVWKQRKDSEARRRTWIALRAVGEAIGRSWTSR